MKSIVRLGREFGWGLILCRTPRFLWRIVATRLSTWYWGCFLQHKGKHVRISPGVRFHRPGNVRIGDYVVISERANFGSENANGQLIIEDYVQINKGCSIDHSGDTVIGHHTLISEDVCILSHSHGYNPRQVSVGIPKTIGSYCWIGLRSMIGENATFLADGVIVAAASVVVRPCEEKNHVYGGVPAKLIKPVED